MLSLSTRFKQALVGSLKSLYTILPMLFAVIGLIGLFQSVVTPKMLHAVFNGDVLHDTLAGTLVGGVSVGQPFFSYIIGGELIKEGISLYAVTAFILAWVTLGIVQLPLEWGLFGKRFTIVRNVLSFLFAMLIAFATVVTLKVLS